jgi:hypothetical protein
MKHLTDITIFLFLYILIAIFGRGNKAETIMKKDMYLLGVTEEYRQKLQ